MHANLSNDSRLLQMKFKKKRNVHTELTVD